MPQWRKKTLTFISELLLWTLHPQAHAAPDPALSLKILSCCLIERDAFRHMQARGAMCCLLCRITPCHIFCPMYFQSVGTFLSPQTHCNVCVFEYIVVGFSRVFVFVGGDLLVRLPAATAWLLLFSFRLCACVSLCVSLCHHGKMCSWVV